MAVGNVVVVPARPEDAHVLARTMREADIRELAACGHAPLEGLLYAMSNGESWTATLDGELGAMFGVCPVADGALLWCLTSHLFGKKPKAFIRAAREAVADLLARYPALGNLIDGRYTGALRLVESLGATFESPRLVGGVPFIPFVFRRA